MKKNKNMEELKKIVIEGKTKQHQNNLIYIKIRSLEKRISDIEELIFFHKELMSTHVVKCECNKKNMNEHGKKREKEGFKS